MAETERFASLVMRPAAAVETLRRAGLDVPDDLLRHVWPLGWDHVSLTGDYRCSTDNPKSN